MTGFARGWFTRCGRRPPERARHRGAPPLGVIIVTIVALLAGCAGAADPEPLAKQGAAVFSAQGCYGCHTVGKTGTPIATDLTHVGGRYSEKQLRSWLADPAVQKPTAHMPKLTLNAAEINSLAAYLATLR
jgi:mono/diheme cytochrome c family protein